MKISELKKLIKEAVKESIQEELKGILLEALKSNTPKQSIQESKTMTFTTKDITPQPSQDVLREQYLRVMDETMNPQGLGQQYDPSAPTSMEGALPPGEVSMDQIFDLMSKK